MDRVQMLFLVAFPISLFCYDLSVLFFTPPPPSSPKPSANHQTLPQQQPPDLAAEHQQQPVRGAAYGSTVEIKYCTSCSYKGTAVTMKKMLEASFPGIDVILSNYPPTLPKRLLSKLVPVAQFGFIGIIMGGDHIFPQFGMAPPQWYHSLRANRFGAMATAWFLGNFAQSSLQSTGAFEVYCNGNLVYSKLKEHSFPSEFELRQLISNALPDPAFRKEPDSIWL